MASGTLLTYLDVSLGLRAGGSPGETSHGELLIAALMILAVGFVDDTRSIGPRVKLLGQTMAVLALYLK